MIIATLFMITYALILTLAPAVRYHAGSERYQYRHWIGVIVWIASFAFLHHISIRKLPERDPYILPVIGLLSGIGLMTIWRLYPNLGMRQTLWIALSTLLVFLGIQYPVFLEYLRRYKYIWLFLGLVLTALTIIMGSNIAGSSRWLNAYSFQLQPSEPLKLVLIVYLAGFFTDRLTIANIKTGRNLFPTLVITGTAMLILFFQRDLGTTSLVLLIYLAMVFTIRRNKIVLWVTPILVIFAGVLGYVFLDVVKIRIDTWLNPLGDTLGASYQIIQSMIAIAEGGVIGAGPGLGSPNLIPVSVSDFIFTAILEELGFLGGVTIILLIIILIYRSIKVVVSTNNSFYRHLTLGLIFYFGFQSILIIGGNIGLLPLTGVTLPFVSYGGSSLLVSFCALLILLTISHQTSLSPVTKPINLPRYTIISHLMIAFLLIEIVATSLLSFWLMPGLVNRPENPRWVINDRFTQRGNILDRNNQIIIINTGPIGNYQRSSTHIPLYTVIGYTNPTFGQTGIEASMFPYLRGNQGYPYGTHFWQDLLYNQPPNGLDIRLTLDLNLQKTADTLLAERPPEGTAGAVVLINAQSGEILAMASHPYFNAENLETQWESLIKDENAPLVNRATQGMYPPGATLFPFVISTQLDLIQQNPAPETLLQNLYSKMACALPPEKDLTWRILIANGCQNAQAELANLTGFSPLLNLYQTIGFFTEPNLRLTVADANPLIMTESDAFYQGEKTFTVTPLQMALATSTITNNGILPGARIVNAYQDAEGIWVTLPKLSNNVQALPIQTASQITTLLKTPDSPYWNVKATVTTDANDTISWYIAGTTAEWQGQPFVVVVILESDTPEIAETIGLSLIDQATQFSE